MKTIFISLCVLSTVLNIFADIMITFDHPGVEGGIQYDSFSENGFLFSGGLSGSFAHSASGLSGTPDNGTAFLNIVRGKTSLSAENGNLFKINQLDLAEYSYLYTEPTTHYFMGILPDDSSVVFAYTTDGIMDGPGPLDDFETVVFPEEFSNLKRLELKTATFAIDNVSLTVIPEPSSIILLLLGTATLVKLRKTWRN